MTAKQKQLTELDNLLQHALNMPAGYKFPFWGHYEGKRLVIVGYESLGLDNTIPSGYVTRTETGVNMIFS